MPTDSERIIVTKQPDDLGSILFHVVSGIQFKLLLFLIFLFLLITSDVFVGRVLSKFKGAVDYKTPTSWGTFLQSLFLVLFFICIDVGIKMKVI